MHLVDTTVFFSPTSGGVKRYLLAKHAWLRANTAWEHSILVPGERERIARGSVCELPGPRVPGTFNYRLPLGVRRWCRALELLEPDLIEAGDAFHPAWCGWRVAERRGIPLVGFFHSNLMEIVGSRFGRWSGRAVARYLTWLYARFDAVLAPSRIVCERLHELGVSHARYQPLGVDTAVFSPQRRSSTLRAALGLPVRKRLLANAGRFAREKNLPVLLGAFARLGAPYHLLLIGGGRSARLAPNVTLLPYRRESRAVAELIASADALVHAGTRETFGLVVLEAMACGRPVVAARAAALPELVDAQVGQLAEPGSSASMADAIAALYERDLEALGIEARSRVLRQHTWTRAFQTLLGTYAQLAGERRVTVPQRPAIEAGSP